MVALAHAGTQTLVLTEVSTEQEYKVGTALVVDWARREWEKCRAQEHVMAPEWGTSDRLIFKLSA